jgi:transporter family protein
MWLILAFTSAALLGFYDVFKKKSLRDNAVIPVLFLNTLFCSLIFLPFILGSAWGMTDTDNLFYIPPTDWGAQKYILLKSCIVLSSWIFGYFGMKHLPLTIVGPINATRPVMVLVGALLVFGERLNLYQWVGVALAVLSFFMLSRSGKKEGINFRHDKWIYFIVLASVLGAVSGLYDKYLMASPENGGVGLDRMVVQSYYNLYQLAMMGASVVVAAQEADHAFPVGLVHPSDFALPVSGRLRLLLCTQLGRCHDFHCLHGAPRQCGRFVPVRSHGFPREELAEQGGGPGVGPARNGVPLFGFPLT